MNREQSLGTVTNNEDPAKGGAVKVAIASMGGEEFPEWVEPIHPAGVFFHPEVGDTVHLDMPEGDDLTEFSEEVRYAGKHTAEAEAYPDEFKENYPHRRGFKTKKGHVLILDDKTGDWLIKTYKGEHEIKLEADGTVTIKNGQSGDSIVMSPSGTVTTTAMVKNVLASPMTDLNAVPTDFLLKGTTFFASFVTTFLQTWKQALELVVPPPLDPNWIAYKAAMTPAVNALISAAAGWVSLTTRTS